MISYKDRTFCKSDCVNKSCYRYFGEYQQAGRAQWWSHDPGNAPIAWADFSGDCEEYMGKAGWIGIHGHFWFFLQCMCWHHSIRLISTP